MSLRGGHEGPPVGPDMRRKGPVAIVRGAVDRGVQRTRTEVGAGKVVGQTIFALGELGVVAVVGSSSGLFSRAVEKVQGNIADAASNGRTPGFLTAGGSTNQELNDAAHGSGQQAKEQAPTLLGWLRGK